MTDEQLQEWQAATDAATPGPWSDDGEGIYSDATGEMIGDTWGPDAYENAAFIIAARTAMPALLAEAAKVRRGHARYCAAVTMYDEPLTFDAWLDMLAGE